MLMLKDIISAHIYQVSSMLLTLSIALHPQNKTELFTELMELTFGGRYQCKY